MPKHQQIQQIQQSERPAPSFQRRTTSKSQARESNPASVIQRAVVNPKSMTQADVLQLQRTIGNREVGRLLSGIGKASTAQQVPVQRQEIPEEEEPLQGKMIETIQRQGPEEEEEEEEPLQGMFASELTGTLQAKEKVPTNKTGMPDNLKSGLESLSGLDLSGVRVHYNSSKPAQFNALAYTRGQEIHVRPGQERHLPHEGWHVVQQMQGRVKPTMQMEEMAVNDDVGLEREADVMGERVFTSGQDEFFRQGAYEPGSRGGQELIAHELTHVVQQNCGAVRRLPLLKHSTTETKSAYEGHKQNAESKPISANGSKEVIQRNIGFEFELDPSLTTHKHGRIYGYNPLKKKDRIMNGQDFYVEADGLPGGKTSWEFVTTDFPETLAGLNRLIATCTHIDGIVNQLRQSNINTYNRVDNAFLNGHGAPVNNRYFKATQTAFRTKPQVTAGFALYALDSLYHSASTAPGGGASNLVRDTNSMDNFGQVNPAHPIDNALGGMRTAANNAIIAAIGNVQGVDALRGLVTHLMQIIIGGQQPIGVTPKTIMRLALGRSDMKTAFNTLPPVIKNPLRGSPDQFEDIVMNAADAYNGGALARDEPVISANLFTDTSYANDPKANMASPFLQVTRSQWLRGLATAGGNDLLSEGHYPVRRNLIGVKNKSDKKANKLLDSMGGLHNAMDPGNRAIFEIRSSAQIFAGLITPYALDFFKYVRYLHDPASLMESNELTGLAINDVRDIVGFDPNAALLKYQMGVDAVLNFNN